MDWKKGCVLLIIMAGLPLCLSGSCKLLPAIEISAGQSAFAATGPAAEVMATHGNAHEDRRIADMTSAEKDRYSKRLRKYVLSDPSFLLKLKGQDIAVLFDEPDMERREGDIISRHYKAGGCLMDIYMRRDSAQDDGQAAIIHYELRSPHLAVLSGMQQTSASSAAEAPERGVPPADCFRKMVEAGQDYMVAAR